jgi:AbrB family looped-hinge helix DNA binding protein
MKKRDTCSTFFTITFYVNYILIYSEIYVIFRKNRKDKIKKRGGRKMLEVIGRIARNGHLTIPSKIRKILNIEDGDIVRFTVEDNKIVISPGVIVDKDQAYFFSERCQKEVRESEKEFKNGKYSSFASVKDLKKAVDSD